MNVLITAGGTTEPLDNVRSITNTSTGKLGCLLAKAYARHPKVDNIYFVCGTNSLIPHSDKIKVISVNTVMKLETVLREITSEANIDVIVHSMAVSDYRISTITSIDKFTTALNAALKQKDKNQELSEDMIYSLLHAPEVSLDRTGKLSSDMKNMILTMEKTQKIISLFQSIAPSATLVGFKLLDHVDYHKLMEAARKIMNQNKCSFVLANDLRDIDENRHIGYLLGEDNSCTKLDTKEEIADVIVNATLKKRGVLI